MVNFVRGWFNPPSPSSGYQNQGNSLFSDTIISVALSALALVAANMFDRNSPGLAALLRCVPVGITLVWLFKRCCPQGNGYMYHHHYPATPVMTPHMPPPSRQHYWNWNYWLQPNHINPAPVHRYSAPPPPHYGPHHQTHNSYSHAHPGTSYSHIYPNPTQPTGFPHVQRAPAQTGGGFPAVQRASAQSRGPSISEASSYHHSTSSHSYSAPSHHHSGGEGERPIFQAAESR